MFAQRRNGGCVYFEREVGADDEAMPAQWLERLPTYPQSPA